MYRRILLRRYSATMMADSALNFKSKIVDFLTVLFPFKFDHLIYPFQRKFSKLIVCVVIIYVSRRISGILVQLSTLFQ